MRNFFVVVAVASLTLILWGCGGGNSSNNDNNGPNGTGNPTSSADAKSMAKNDRTLLNVFSSEGAASFDANYNGNFAKVFGGESGAAVLNYFDTRIHYMVSAQDLGVMTLSPGKPHYTGWSKSASSAGNSGTGNSSAGTDIQVGAANIGMHLWFQAVLDNVPYVVGYSGQKISIDTSRVGFMLIGPGYQAKEGNIVIPPSYRQGILLHEARHSDCTGGVTQDDLNQVRQMTSSEQFMANFQHRDCGHMHTICPSGDYKGYPACDTEIWGAYVVGAIYYLAQGRNAVGQEKQIMNIAALDALSRLQYNYSDLLKGRLGDPDMSSSGVR